MPNWCVDEVTVFGDQANLMRFFLDMKNATSKEPKFKSVENDWEENWLGNLFLAAGYDSEDVAKSEHIQCRGWVDNIEYVDDTVKIYYNTAWGPNFESMRLLVNNYDLNFVGMAEEGGMGVYVNTDVDRKYYKAKWFLDISLNDEYLSDRFDTDKDLVEFLHVNFPKIIKKDTLTVEEVRKILEKKINDDSDDYLVLEEYCSE